MQREKEKRANKSEKEFLLKIKVFKTPQSFDKAFIKSFTSLWLSQRKQKAVAGGVAKTIGLKLGGKMERKLKSTETTKKRHRVSEFFLRKDISYTTRGMKDFITI